MPPLFHHLRPIGTKLFKFCRCPAARPSGRPLFAGDKRMRRAPSMQRYVKLRAVQRWALRSTACALPSSPPRCPPPRDFVRRRFHSRLARGSGGRAPRLLRRPRRSRSAVRSGHSVVERIASAAVGSVPRLSLSSLMTRYRDMPLTRLE